MQILDLARVAAARTATMSWRTVSGSYFVEVGRMASWASWALFLLLQVLGSAGTRSWP